MKTIWKFPLEITDTQQVMMPKGAQILATQTQNNRPCLWAEVDPNAPTESREIEIIGTGNPMPVANRRYIGTVQTHGGMLVWHVFERE